MRGGGGMASSIAQFPLHEPLPYLIPYPPQSQYVLFLTFYFYCHVPIYIPDSWPTIEASRTMSSLTTEALLTLLALLFCLPQLILSALTWYERRCARLHATQSLDRERCMRASRHSLPALHRSLEDVNANRLFIARGPGHGSRISVYNTGLPMDIPAPEYRSRISGAVQSLTRTSTDAYQFPLLPTPTWTGRSVSWPVEPSNESKSRFP
ncbi:hypothetical protein F5X96DRAFT_568778 [Biscogniauxia mediterranea]|nr:hypothetical protein F5X96DRAFT_568778 [Biscogniauxia mediterranea]